MFNSLSLYQKYNSFLKSTFVEARGRLTLIILSKFSNEWIEKCFFVYPDQDCFLHNTVVKPQFVFHKIEDNIFSLQLSNLFYENVWPTVQLDNSGDVFVFLPFIIFVINNQSLLKYFGFYNLNGVFGQQTIQVQQLFSVIKLIDFIKSVPSNVKINLFFDVLQLVIRDLRSLFVLAAH